MAFQLLTYNRTDKQRRKDHSLVKAADIFDDVLNQVATWLANTNQESAQVFSVDKGKVFVLFPMDTDLIVDWDPDPDVRDDVDVLTVHRGRKSV